MSEEVTEENVRVIRVGHGANCSSIGSVVDTLFVSAVVGGAVLGAVLAAMKKETAASTKRSEASEDLTEPSDGASDDIALRQR